MPFPARNRPRHFWKPLKNHGKDMKRKILRLLFRKAIPAMWMAIAIDLIQRKYDKKFQKNIIQKQKISMASLKKLGKSDLLVSPIAFGGNGFGWTLNEKESFKILDAWIDAGFNFIDTADTYSTWVPGNSGGESETIIGKWLHERGRRDDVIIATKLGGEMGENKKGLSAKYISEAVEASLKRLKTDYIDLYQSHYDDPETPISETMEAFDKLIKEGKVRYIGASNL